MRTTSHSNSAFTLIELLVVIALIGLLASVVVVSVYEVRAKARDIKRIAEAAEIRKALNVYLLAYGHYPEGADDGGGWDIGNINHSTGNEFIPQLVDAGLFEKTPIEEYFVGISEQAETWTYRYSYLASPEAINACGSPFYVLLIKLERDQARYNVEDQIPDCVRDIISFPEPEKWYTIAETE